MLFLFSNIFENKQTNASQLQGHHSGKWVLPEAAVAPAPSQSEPPLQNAQLWLHLGRMLVLQDFAKDHGQAEINQLLNLFWVRHLWLSRQNTAPDEIVMDVGLMYSVDASLQGKRKVRDVRAWLADKPWADGQTWWTNLGLVDKSGGKTLG